jgi:DNA transformation protein
VDMVRGMGARTPRRIGRLKPLTVTDTFRRFVLTQLDELGDVTSRAMFGGIGLYYRDVFFGIIACDVLYMKVDPGNQPDYLRAGMHPFVPYPDRSGSRGSKGTSSYYAVPTGILECASDLAEWARKSIGAAERGVAMKAAKRR